MRHLYLLLLTLVAASAFAAPKLSRDVARKRISELSSSQLVPDAIEIREISQDSAGRAIVETTITLAFLFKKTSEGWAIDAIRLGDADWMDMSELLAAIYHGAPPEVTASPAIPVPKRMTPIEALHINQSDFEK